MRYHSQGKIIACSTLSDMATFFLINIKKTKRPKAIFIFSRMDHNIVGTETKRYMKMLEQYPDNFLGIYDSRVHTDWISDDLKYYFENNPHI